MVVPDFLRRDEFGEIFLAGHRVCLHHLVSRYADGASPELLVALFPTVPLATVHKVIAFYLENRAKVDEYVAETRAAIEVHASIASNGPSTAELRKRMAERVPAKSA